MKRQVYISVIGKPNTGKTTVMKRIIQALSSADIEVESVWGVDGPPLSLPEEAERMRLIAVAKKVKVTVTEFQTAGNRTAADDPNELRIEVAHVGGIGYEATLWIAGNPLRRNFGDSPAGKERARAVANRLAAELSIEVDDTLPSEISTGTQPYELP